MRSPHAQKPSPLGKVDCAKRKTEEVSRRSRSPVEGMFPLWVRQQPVELTDEVDKARPLRFVRAGAASAPLQPCGMAFP